MKKLVLLLLVLVMAFVGCGKEETTVANQNNPMIQAFAELKSYLEKPEHKDFFKDVVGEVGKEHLTTNVYGEQFIFTFKSNSTSVVFFRGTEIKEYSSVANLIAELEKIKAKNAGYLTVTGLAHYTSSDTIVLKFKERVQEETVKLDKPLTDGQNFVEFEFEGKKYSVQLKVPYIDASLYETLNQDAVMGILQSANSNTILIGIQKDIVFPSTVTLAGGETYSITWNSSNTAVIDNTGKVTRPEATTNVNLTVSFKYESTVDVQASVSNVPNVFDIQVTVLQQDPQVSGYYLEVIVENEPRHLIANGRTVMEIVATLMDANGVVTDMAGTADFLSDLELESAQDVASFENGRAKFKVTLPVGQAVIEDLISVKIASSTNKPVSNLVSGKVPVRYLPDNINGGANQDSTFEYVVDEVKSFNVADRVLVTVGGVRDAHLEAVKLQIINQIKVYNEVSTSGAIDLLEIVSEEVNFIDNEGNKSYSFEVLTKLPKYSAAKTDYNNTKIILKDNQKNYWSVTKSEEKIRFAQNTLKEENYFYLLDSVRPLVSRVVSFTDDLGYLPADSVVVVYSKPINRLTAENPRNYVMNTKRLDGSDSQTSVPYTKYIRVLDKDSATLDDEGKALLEYQGIKDLILEGFEERQIVIIKLSRKFARLYLENNNDLGEAENKLAYENIKDWAGMTDHTDNNVVPSDDMKFKHTKPEGEGKVELFLESPEQFVLKVSGVYGGQEDLDELALIKDMIDITIDTHDFNATTEGGVVLSSKNITNDVVISKSNELMSRVPEDYIAQYGERYYVIELTRDYTRIMNNPEYVYEGKYFSVKMKEDKYDAFGNTIFKEELRDQIMMTQDIQSPTVANYKILNETNPGVTTSGGFWFKMDEPVQVYSQTSAGAIIASVSPAVTPELNKDVLPPSIEYVQQNAADGGPVQGKVIGNIVEVETLHDKEFVIFPSEELSEGNWRLVIKDFGDDVTNNRDTVAYNFIVKKEEKGPVVDPTIDNRINPYILWSFAVNDITTTEQKDDGSGNLINVDVVNDYVYIMYSRRMTSTATDTATYDINGKQLKDGVAITTETIPLYRVNSSAESQKYYEVYGQGDYEGSVYQGYLVKIRLPQDFLTGDDNTPTPTAKPYRKNILTVPSSLTAVNDYDDNFENPTTENLLFDNNNNENQYELTFVGDQVYDLLYNGGNSTSGTAITYGSYYEKGLLEARSGK